MTYYNPRVYSSLNVQAAAIIDTYEGEIVLMDNAQGDEIFVLPTEEAQMVDLDYRRKSILDSAHWYRPNAKDNPSVDQWFGPYETEEEMLDAIDDEYLGDNGAKETYSINKLPQQRAASDITAVIDAGVDDFIGGQDDSIAEFLDVDDPDDLPENITL